MLIKDLIKQLQDLYSSYDEEYKEVMGEPAIGLDVFRLKYPDAGLYTNTDRVYAGISDNIKINKYPPVIGLVP